MSKISQLHAELSSQAYDLGFNSLEDALAMGYEVDYENSKLVDGREQAHKAWLKEKREILNELNAILNAINGQAYNNFSNYELLTFIKNNKQIIAKAIEFIEKGEV